MARTRTAASRARHSSVSTVRREDMSAFALRQAGHQAGDLDRQFGAHIFIVVIGQQPVGGGGRGGIGGHRGARRPARAWRGQIMQHIGPGIGAGRQFAGAHSCAVGFPGCPAPRADSGPACAAVPCGVRWSMSLFPAPASRILGARRFNSALKRHGGRALTVLARRLRPRAMFRPWKAPHQRKTTGDGRSGPISAM